MGEVGIDFDDYITQKEKYLLKKKTGKKGSESVEIAIRHYLNSKASLNIINFSNTNLKLPQTPVTHKKV